MATPEDEGAGAPPERDRRCHPWSQVLWTWTAPSRRRRKGAQRGRRRRTARGLTPSWPTEARPEPAGRCVRGGWCPVGRVCGEGGGARHGTRPD